MRRAFLWYNPIMNVEDLNKVKSEIETSYNNLSNPQWVAMELSHLKGKFEVLSEVITKLEGEQNATDSEPGRKKVKSNIG